MPETRNRFENLYLSLKKGLIHRFSPVAPADRKRLFVAGMQRSGTNMTMEVIEQSTETDVYHEYDLRAFSNYEMREPATIRQLTDASRARLFVIKSLCELQDLDHLMQQLAPAKTVWIVRHYEDVINSMLRSFQNMTAQVQRIAAEKGYQDEWLARGMSEDTYDIVRRFSDKGLSDAEASGVQWYFRNVLFFEQGFDHNPHVLLVFYEDLVTQPVQEFERIFQFSEIQFETKFTSRIFAHSIRKNRTPDIAPEVKQLCKELYERFQGLRR